MKNEEIPSVIRKRPLFIILLSLLFFIGIALVFLSVKDQSSSLTDNTAAANAVFTENENAFSNEGYVSSLEKRLKEMISSIDGVENVKVMITLKNTSETIYAEKTEERDLPSGKERSSSIILRKAKNGDEVPIPVSEKLPVIGGAAVTCSGNINGTLKAEIISLISCALDLPTNKIYVGG